MKLETFNEYKKVFENVGEIGFSTELYDWLFDYFMNINNQISLWNYIHTEVIDKKEEIIYYTKDINNNHHKQRCGFEELELLQELMYPYYRYINNEPSYYNVQNLSMYITDDLYYNKYDVLNFIFENCEHMCSQ